MIIAPSSSSCPAGGAAPREVSGWGSVLSSSLFPQFSGATAPAAVTYTSPFSVLTSDRYEIWNAGHFAPAGLRFDFAAPFWCTRVDLMPRMVPETGDVVHELRVHAAPPPSPVAAGRSGGGGGGGATYRRTLRCRASDGEWIRVGFPGSATAVGKGGEGGASAAVLVHRTVDLVTLASPSWVAWRRVRFWGRCYYGDGHGCA
jgi:hypothetical protein